MTPASEPSPCLDCGLCCDGTMYSHVRLTAGDRVTADSHQIRRTIVEDKPAVREPCPALAGTACTIYSERFAICRSYRCATLKALDESAIDRAEAVRRIAAAKEAANRVHGAMPEGQTLHTARQEWADEPERQRATAEGARLHLLMTALEMLLGRYFREEGENRLWFGEGSE